MADLTEYESTDLNDEALYQLHLYVTGASMNSIRAITNIKDICERHLSGNYSLKIIDVYQQKEIAQQEQLIALPLLIKRKPLPERRFIGDLSNTDKVVQGLGISLTNE